MQLDNNVITEEDMRTAAEKAAWTYVELVERLADPYTTGATYQA